MPASISTMSAYICLSTQKFPGKLYYKKNFCNLCSCWNKYGRHFILSDIFFIILYYIFHWKSYSPILKFLNFLSPFSTPRLTVISIEEYCEPLIIKKKIMHVSNNLYDFCVMDSSKNVLPSSQCLALYIQFSWNNSRLSKILDPHLIRAIRAGLHCRLQSKSRSKLHN